MQPKTPLFTSGSQHPPRFGHAVYLGEDNWGETDQRLGVWCNTRVAIGKLLIKQAIISHGKTGNTFWKYNITVKETYKRFLVFLNCVMEDALMTFLGGYFDWKCAKTQDFVCRGKPFFLYCELRHFAGLTTYMYSGALYEELLQVC